MHHSHLHQSFPYGKAPDRALKRKLKEEHLERTKGKHLEQDASHPYELGPRQSKVWQALKHTAVKRTRAAHTDVFGVDLNDTTL